MKTHSPQSDARQRVCGVANRSILSSAIGWEILCLAILLLGLVSEGHCAVIYRNNLGNSGTDYAGYPTARLKALGANNDLDTVANSTGYAPASSFGISPAAGLPANLSNVNAGSSPSNANGFGIAGSGIRELIYTDTFSIDRTTNQIDTIQWYGAQQKNKTSNGSIRVALKVGSQWYVSQNFSLAGSTIPMVAGTPAAEYEAQFATYATQYSLDFQSATWFTLTATIGTPFQIGTSSVALPATGDIAAIGLYVAAPGSGASYFDTLEINAMAVPESKVTALLGIGVGILLLARGVGSVRRAE